MNQEELIKRYINIGFCQQKFYRPPAWQRGLRCLEVLVKKGLAEPYNFGRGKGKFITTPAGDALGTDLWKAVLGEITLTEYIPRKL